MNFTWHDHGDWVEARLIGLLDNESAEPLSQALNELIRNGHHRLMLNLQGVTFVSSAGISTLLKAHKQLTAIRGFFAVCEPPPQVAQVLRLTKLDRFLVRDADAAKVRDAFTATMLVMSPEDISRFQSQGLTGTVYTLEPSEPLRLKLVGDPSRLGRHSYSEADAQVLNCEANTIALGLGALGLSMDGCRDRFGEFLSVCGAAAHQPTGGRRAADFQATAGDFVPQVQTLYAMQCAGAFSHLIRFGGEGDSPRVPLSKLVGRLWETSDAPALGVVMVVESAGLVGASLKQSPVSGVTTSDDNSLFRHPGVRDWLSYAPEHVHARSLAVIVGVLARAPLADKRHTLSAWLRPLDSEGSCLGHLHAAVFAYRPIKKGFIELAATVGSLFESESLQAVLHLLPDRRAINGAGESEFISGACWFGELTS